ncbi:MAG: hypothetical protein ACFFAO_20630 [Candidatus Hermodarchaeota archaeon]
MIEIIISLDERSGKICYCIIGDIISKNVFRKLIHDFVGIKYIENEDGTFCFSHYNNNTGVNIISMFLTFLIDIDYFLLAN